MAKSCDTFVVLPNFTEHGGIIFGKNSDRPRGEVQELVYTPSETYKEGDNVKVIIYLIIAYIVLISYVPFFNI